MQWTNHGERPVYESPWVSVLLADVEVPDGPRFDHHLVRVRAAAGTVVNDPDRGVLLLWRHRFITDTWGWEIPGGGVDAGETSIDAACREALEESGWRVGGDAGTVEHLVDYFPMNGLGDNRFDLFLARGAHHEGEPTDPSEAERVDWVPVGELRGHIAAGKVQDGLSLSALLWCLAFELI